MKKFLALMIAFIMVFSLLNVASFADPDDPAAGGEGGEGGGTPVASTAVNITIHQDSTYAGTAGEAGRNYHWYQVFTAVPSEDFTGNIGEDGGYNDDGTPGDVAGDEDHGVAYIASAAVAAKLGTIGTDGTWTADSENVWFELTPMVGKDTFSVKWIATTIPDGATEPVPDTSSATAQAAAAWLLENEVYDEDDDLTWNSDDAVWEGIVAPGYYIIQAYGDSLTADSSGANLIAATTDINIYEKNAYPPLDKTQADEDIDEQTNNELNVAVGDTITYEVKVTIPVTAKAGDTIDVWDIPSAGLDYQDDVAVKSGSNTGSATIADGTLGTGEIWHKVITVVDGSQGTDVVFTFTCVVTEDALTDTERENEAQLSYGNEYESLPDTVTYTTYFGGIHKFDPETNEDLEGVEFTLKEDGDEFKVTLTDDGYYIPDAANGSSTVVTDENGMIYIRGLDADKTYTLTETKPLDGYNMLDGDITLTLTEDTPGAAEDDTSTEVDETIPAFTAAQADTSDDTYWVQVENRQGTILPSTGGIGTTLFYVIGGILVAGAFVLLVTKRRMAAKN